MLAPAWQDHLIRDIQQICEKRNATARRRHASNTETEQGQQRSLHSGMPGGNEVGVSIHKGCIVKFISVEDKERRTRGRGRSSRKILVKYCIARTSLSPAVAGATVDTAVHAGAQEGDSKLHELHADIVLVTLPLGVLQQSIPKPASGATMVAGASAAQVDDGVDRKRAAITFSPPLSKAKQEAIHALGMGLENKVLLRFPIHDDDGPTTAISGDGASSQAAAAEPVGQPDTSPFIRRLRKLKYFQVADPKFRLLSLHGMDHRAKPGCLLVHVAPPHAHTTHQMQQPKKAGQAEGSEYAVVGEILELLRDIFGPSVHVPQPIEVKVTAWHRDPFALGAYSHMPPNATVIHKHEMLQPEGVATEATKQQAVGAGEKVPAAAGGSGGDGGAWDGRLMFAGEGCSIVAHQCVHGAFETGEAQAIKILNTLAGLSPPLTTQMTAGATAALATASRPAKKAKKEAAVLESKDRGLATAATAASATPTAMTAAQVHLVADTPSIPGGPHF